MSSKLIRRRPILRAALAAPAILTTWRQAQAQEDGPLIVMVLPRGERATEEGFRDYFQRRGLPVRIDVQQTEGGDRIPEIIQHIRDVDADLVYTWGTPTTSAVAGPWDAADPSQYITDRPVVFCTVTDAVASGIVRTAAAPGRSVTGTSHIPPLDVQLNTMTAYADVRKVACIFNGLERNSEITVEALRPLLAERDIDFDARAVPLAADGRPDIEAVPGLVRQVSAAGADFLYIGPDTFVAFTARDPLTETALNVRLPTFAVTETIVRQSHALIGLFSAGLSVGRFTAFKAEQILFEGRDPATIPVETLQRFSLLINMPVARAIEAYPPLTLLDLAEIVDEGG